MTALLTAIVFLLQYYVGQSIKFGPFSITLVLIPIVIGAAECGIWAGAWLGAVFGLTVLVSGDAATFLQINAWATVLTVMLKGILAGLAAGWVYRWLCRYNKYLAVAVSSVVCPIVNSAIFAWGCSQFFLDDIDAWAAEAGQSAAAYIFLVLIGVNFLIELGINILLNPVIVRILNVKHIKS